MLWELAYSEIYVTKTSWPDFRREHLYEAIREYQQRERRFGMTGAQEWYLCAALSRHLGDLTVVCADNDAVEATTLVRCHDGPSN